MWVVRNCDPLNVIRKIVRMSERSEIPMEIVCIVNPEAVPAATE
jgi:hypothetical protein